jgi:NAD(P)-dependent dehydrogenase (short-subunit alcohol dehydrogenase family)
MSKKVIIIGASSGIGKALALKYAKEGFEVGITARRTKLLQKIVEELPSAQFFKEEMDVEKIESARNILVLVYRRRVLKTNSKLSISTPVDLWVWLNGHIIILNLMVAEKSSEFLL